MLQSILQPVCLVSTTITDRHTMQIYLPVYGIPGSTVGISGKLLAWNTSRIDYSSTSSGIKFSRKFYVPTVAELPAGPEAVFTAGSSIP